MPYLYFQKERDRDFLRVCEGIRREHNREGKYISVSDIALKALHSEADSFYITKRECVKIIHEYKKGLSTGRRSAAKRELALEILRRYRRMSEESPEWSVPQISEEIVSQRAPRFYISEARAKCLYYELLSKRDGKRI